MYNDPVTLQSHQHLELSLYVILTGVWWYLIVVLIYISIMIYDEHLVTCLWSESHSVVSNSLQPHGLYSPWNSPGQNTRVGSHSLLKGIFPKQGSNTGLPHCRQILYQLSHQGSPFMCLTVIFISSSVETFVPIFCPFSKWIAGGFILNFHVFLYILLQLKFLKFHIFLKIIYTL